MKKAILLDLDNTIYNYDIPHKKGLESAYKLLKTKLNLSKVKFFKLYNLARQEIHKELSGTASAHSRVLYFQRLIEKLHEDVKPELIVSLHDTYWNIFFKSMTLPKKTLNALKKLKEKGLKIAIVSDFTTLIQLKKLKTLKISQYIDFLVTSEEAGSEKPHAIMFLLALNKMDVAPSDALMVGDNEIADIEGANFVGMDTVLLSSKTNTNKVHSDDYREPNYTLKEFSHLVEVVDAMNLKMIQTEGYVKYNSVFKKTKPLKEDISELNSYRQRLYNKKLVGAYDNKIGYGNVSTRHKKGFIISGTATGNFKTLSNKDYSFVSSWDIDNNSLKCSGGTKASSESMTHGAVYDCNSQIGAVVHIHNLKYWKTFINKLPTTNKHATYGTPEIANEIKRLYKETDFKTKKVAVLGGHKEGIISFGKNIKEAYNNILKYYNQLK